MGVKERVKEYQAAVGISDYRMEKLIQKGKGWWGNCKNPTGENIQLILNALPELSAEWVMRGEGNMIRKTPENTLDVLTENYYRTLLQVKQERISALENEIATIRARLVIPVPEEK